jgi:hypothetical protein
MRPCRCCKFSLQCRIQNVLAACDVFRCHDGAAHQLYDSSEVCGDGMGNWPFSESWEGVGFGGQTFGVSRLGDEGYGNLHR